MDGMLWLEIGGPMMTECIALVSWRELTRALLHLRRYLVDRGYWISRPRDSIASSSLLCLGIHDHDASYTRYYRQVDPGNVTNTWLFDSWWVQHNRTDKSHSFGLANSRS